MICYEVLIIKKQYVDSRRNYKFLMEKQLEGYSAMLCI
jgi:hypothetical protein